jgi:Ca2+-binding EF-hand superfamily protein
MMCIGNFILKPYPNPSSIFPSIVTDIIQRDSVCRKRQLAPDQVEELRALFCIYDRDGSGMIDMDELLEALPSVGYEEEDFRTLFNTYDIDKNGLLDCEEFLNLMADVFQ